MTGINFVKKRIKKQKNNLHWLVVTGVLILLCTFIAMTILQIRQWSTLHKLKTEWVLHKQNVRVLDNVLNEKKNLLDQQQVFKKKVAKLELLNHNPRSPFATFCQLRNALGTTSSLETISIVKNTIDLTIRCNNINSATRFMRNATELSSIKSMRIVSINPHTNQSLRFTMKGIRARS